MFREDLETIDQLRLDAVTSLEAHTSGVKKLAAYAAQLVWISGKFPIDVRQAVYSCAASRDATVGPDSY